MSKKIVLWSVKAVAMTTAVYYVGKMVGERLSEELIEIITEENESKESE